MNLRSLLLMLFCTAAVAGCSVETEILPPATGHVLIVYIGGDNTLSNEVYTKIKAITDGYPVDRKQNKILLYCDRAGGEPSLMEVTGVQNDMVSMIRGIKELAVYPPENSASTEVFGRVIHDAMAKYPSASSYGLLLFSHASGWLPRGALLDPNKSDYEKGEEGGSAKVRSIMVDGVDEMELADFAAAIPDHTFDYIVFEMCFMAGIEVAYELRNKTPCILASSAEIVSPGFSFVYPASIALLLAGDVQGFAERVFNYVQSYESNQVECSATYSVIRTAGLGELASFINQHCDFDRSVTVTDVQHFDRYNYRLFFDLEDYYSRLLNTEQERTELNRLIANCVAWREATPVFMTQMPGLKGFSINKHCGLTTYIPQPQFTGLNARYEELQWSRAAGLTH